MTALSEILLPEEREAARPPERRPVAEWCDENRWLAPEGHGKPGWWRTGVTPYLAEIMEAVRDALCRIVVMMCSTQVGKSEAMINAHLWAIDQDPMPAMHVLPTEGQLDTYFARRLKVAVMDSPAVRKHVTGRKTDWQKQELGFDSMVLYGSWANSAAKLSEKSVGRIMLDEVDKFPPFTGREAPPVELAKERLQWWHDSTLFMASTPTTQHGAIYKEWETTDKRHFHVPCLGCGTFQPLTLEAVVSRGGERDPDRIRRERLGDYGCTECGLIHEDTDKNKSDMLARGVWCPEGGTVTKEGEVEGVALDGERRGYHLNALYSPVLTWSQVLAEFFESKDDHGKLMNFRNSRLGLPWVEASTALDAELVKHRQVHGLQRLVVPDDAIVLTAGVDVQGWEIFYALRAHSLGERTVTISAGTIDSWEQLEVILFDTSYTTRSGDRKLQVRLACIDSGYETDEVYAFCGKWPHITRPTKGFDKRPVPISSTAIERDYLGKAGGMRHWNIDTGYYKTKLVRHMRNDLGARGSWAVHLDPDTDYIRQVTSEHRVLVRKKNGTLEEAWKKKPGAAGNHLFDAEVLNTVAGDMLGLQQLTDDVDAAALRSFLDPAEVREPSTRPSREPEDPPRRLQRWRDREPRRGRRRRRRFEE